MPYKDKKKQAEYQNQWLCKRRENWLKENGPCKCGSNKNLQVDHIDPKKKLSHRIWNWSEERRNAELAKCQVLCGNCHKEKTKSEKISHGISRYQAGCRCEICKRAKSLSNKRNRP